MTTFRSLFLILIWQKFDLHGCPLLITSGSDEVYDGQQKVGGLISDSSGICEGQQKAGGWRLLQQLLIERSQGPLQLDVLSLPGAA